MHLYDKTGKPMYETPYADPKKGNRKTTLRDAKKHGWVPSVTTVLDILDKPGLNVWLQERLLESALTLSRKQHEPDKAYFARIKQDSKEISLLARNEGTRIHNEIESEFKGRSVNSRYKSITRSVKQDVFDYFATADGWISEEYFAHLAGYGGKVDLNNRDIEVVIDFKTKEEFKRDKKGIAKMAFDEQAMQLSAYAHGLKMPNARIVNIFVDYYGNTHFHEWSNENGEITRAYHMFMACLKLWKLQKRYDPCEI